MKTPLACLLIAVSGGCFAADDITSGNFYYKLCSDKQARDVCLGYVYGFSDGLFQHAFALSTYQNYQSYQRELGLCVPDSVTHDQSLDVFVKYLKEHPETRNEYGPTLLIKSWKAAWPCPKQ